MPGDLQPPLSCVHPAYRSSQNDGSSEVLTLLLLFFFNVAALYKNRNILKPVKM